MIRLEMTRKQEAVLAAIIVIIAVGVFVLSSGMFGTTEPVIEEAPPEPISLKDIIDDRIEWQDELDEEYLEEFEEGGFDLANPYIIMNPYGTAPLTALFMFETEEPMRISVNVMGKSADTSVFHTFNKYETTHIIPIYGLYPNMTNLVELIAEPRSQSSQETTVSQFLLETGGVPDRFPSNLILQYVDYSHEQDTVYSDLLELWGVITGVELYSEEFPSQQSAEFLFTFARKSAFDKNGDYRWFYDGYGTDYPTAYTDDGNFLIIVGSFKEKDALLLEINMLGKILSAEPIDDESEIDGNDYRHVERRQIYAG